MTLSTASLPFSRQPIPLQLWSLHFSDTVLIAKPAVGPQAPGPVLRAYDLYSHLGLTLGLMSCYHCFRILNSFSTRASTFTFYIGPHKLCSWSFSGLMLLSLFKAFDTARHPLGILLEFLGSEICLSPPIPFMAPSFGLPSLKVPSSSSSSRLTSRVILSSIRSLI